MNVAEWLRRLGLEQYEPAFRDNDIDGEVLRQLTADDLRELGIASIGHRRRLLDAIAALAAEDRPDVASGELAAGAAPTEGERRQLTVMFCDLVGSTALSARFDPEDLREVIGAYHRCVAATVGRFAGFVAKYMGDGVLVYFGYPQAHEDDSERAMRAGLAVVDAISRLETAERLQVRLGIASGLVVVRGVVGETPNLAARLQGLAEPNTVVVADGTRRQLGGLFEVEDLGPQSLAGFAEKQRAWRVLGESGVVSRFEALRSGATPLVGRDEEVDLLLRRWQQAKAGEGRVVLVSGEPGIGKSRLTAALSEQITADPHTRLRYFCSPHHQDSALPPFIVQLERAAGFGRDDTADQKRARLDALLSSGARNTDELTLLAELLSLPNNAADLNLSPQRKREMLFEALLRQLAAVAQHQPVLMVFEDAHWIDPTSRELLDLTIDRARHLPMLLVVTFRPEFQALWGGQPHVTMSALNRLGDRDGVALVQNLAGNAALDAEIVAEIVERTDGVPLFVEELTKAVLESADQENRVAAVLAASPASTLAIPATLHASLIARLDRLGTAAKEVAQIGAVLGREFTYELIDRVARRPDLDGALGRLTDAGLLFCRGVAPHSSYIFKHALVQDAAYGTLLRGRRQELHARVAAVLEQQFADLVERQPELLAHHLTGAGEAERAAAYWYQAGQQANARFAIREAVAHFTRGIESLAALPNSDARDRRELDFQLALAVPLIAGFGFGSEQVELCAWRAKELSDKGSDARSRFLAYRFVWNSCLLRRPVPQAVALARTLMEFAQQDSDPARLAIVHRALGYSMQMAGALTEANKLLSEGTSLADGVSDIGFAVYGEDPGMVCRVNRGLICAMAGHLEEAARLARASIHHARTRNNPFTLAWSLCVAADVYDLLRDTSAAEQASREAVALSEEHRLPQWLAFAQNTLGRTLCWQGNSRKGIELQEEGMRSLHAIGSVLHTTRCRQRLAESFLELGELTQARSNLEAAFVHFRTHGEGYLASEMYRVQFMLLQAEATSREALEDTLRSGLDIARSQGARLLELRLATTAARLWGEQGRREEARELLAPVYGWFTEGFDTADLKDAAALLAELT